MRIILIVLLSIWTNSLLCQTYDVVIKKSNYTSYFEYDYMNPTVVVYKLYHGGGDCNRSKFHFKNDEKIKTATNSDYLKSGYDKGHLANAEDFAFDCVLDELTFRYYNCVPQNPKMNRGPWKSVENEIREWSQSKELLIICINIFGNQFIKGTKIGIPTVCIKLVYDSKTKEPITGFTFTNTSNPVTVRMSPDKIVENWKLNISQFLN